jgi:hypothetical protein
MSSYKELTENQRKPLFVLVNYQKNVNREVRFLVDLYRPIFHIIDAGVPRGIVIQEIPIEYLKIWVDNEFLTVSPGPFTTGEISDLMTFVLRKEAFDYESFMRKSKFQRLMIKLGEKLFDDISSLVWPIIVSIITTIIVYFILRGIGAKP